MHTILKKIRFMHKYNYKIQILTPFSFAFSPHACVGFSSFGFGCDCGRERCVSCNDPFPVNRKLFFATVKHPRHSNGQLSSPLRCKYNNFIKGHIPTKYCYLRCAKLGLQTAKVNAPVPQSDYFTGQHEHCVLPLGFFEVFATPTQT